MEIPDWTLERYLLGELPLDDLERVRTAAASDAVIRGRLDALERTGRELLLERPPARVAAAIRERAASPEARPRLRWSAPALAAVAVALVAAVALPFLLSNRKAKEDTRIKGLVPYLVVYRQTADGPERLGDGTHALAGDLVQVSYQAAGRSYGVIFSLDGRGVTTLHLPREGSHAAPLAAGAVALDLAYRLDDAPRWERFYFVAARQPFAIDQVLRAVPVVGGDTGLRLALPHSFDQFTLTLEKEP